MTRGRLIASLVVTATAGSLLLLHAAHLHAQSAPVTWQSLPYISMQGGLKVFWNVGDGTKGENEKEALAHGFSPLTLVNTFSDYPGAQKENINSHIGKGSHNPWNKPPFFERIVRRNADISGSKGTSPRPSIGL